LAAGLIDQLTTIHRWLMRRGAPVTGAAAGTTIPLAVLLGLSASQNQQ
jgi:hypothetical protein